jgi:phthalate 4,5-dioxygenase oxygenase subunit
MVAAFHRQVAAHAVERTPYGFRYAAIRRPIKDAQTHDYIRSTVFVAPASALIPPNDQYNVANMNVPIDDHHTAFHFMACGSPDTTPDNETWRAFLHAQVGPDLDAQFHPKRSHDNRFGQDRAAMKAGNFTGIQGIPNQDMAMWVSMGPIVDRTNDRLGALDLAIVEFRQRMLQAVRSFMAGEVPIGTGQNSMPVKFVLINLSFPKPPTGASLMQSLSKI